MRPLRFGLATLLFACSSNSGGNVNLAPTLVFPQGVLDGVTRLTVSVYDGSGSLDCSAADGTVTGLNGDTPLATKDLSSSNCPNNAKFCGDISIDKSGSARLFAAQAFVGTSSAPVASGCTKMPNANQDNLAVSIKMLRTLPPQTCNGNPSSVIVQCATGPDSVCDAKCQSIEVYLSKGDGSSTGDTAQKFRPMLAWPVGTGDAARLLGVWGDRTKGANTPEVAMRVLADDMNPYSGQGQFLQDNSFRMPATSGLPPASYPLSQSNPTIASINGSYYIAFEDTSGVPATAIKIRSFDSILNPQQVNPVLVSGSTNVAQSTPSMAAKGSNLFVAWDNNGTIVGNVIAVSGTTLTPGTQKTLGPGTDVSVAATSSGWVAVWQNGTDVDMATIDASGTPGQATKVNGTAGASHPGVAAFGSTVAVVWADGGGSIRVQRYTSGTAVANDQVNALEDPSLGGGQSAPSVAAGTDFFIAAWVDGKSGHVRGRFLDGTSGYKYNLVNGQNTDFQASVTGGETRDNPIAVVGGNNGQYVAIAWEDNTGAPSSYKGIWARRFPLPQ